MGCQPVIRQIHEIIIAVKLMVSVTLYLHVVSHDSDSVLAASLQLGYVHFLTMFSRLLGKQEELG